MTLLYCSTMKVIPIVVGTHSLIRNVVCSITIGEVTRERRHSDPDVSSLLVDAAHTGSHRGPLWAGCDFLDWSDSPGACLPLRRVCLNLWHRGRGCFVARTCRR